MRLMLPGGTVWQTDPSLRNALGTLNMVAPIISVVGAGGKTSTIEYLAKEYETAGKKVIVTTTTKMFRPEKWTWCKEESVEAVDKHLEKATVLWIGLPCEGDKMRSPQLLFLEQLQERQLPMLIEADGAKRLPFKIPGDQEPVILAGSHMVIGVLGMDALEKPIKEVCFRAALVASYLHKTEEDILTEEDYVTVIKSSEGLKKNVTKDMEYLVLLNKVEGEKRQEQALKIREMLQKQGIEKVYLSSFQ